MIIIGKKSENVLLSLLNHNNSGSVVSYFGYVRNFVNDKRVARMVCSKKKDSEETMRNIEREMQERFSMIDIILYHSIGILKPNDLVAAVLVSTIHRTEGFEACKFGIDRIKALEPIKRVDIFED